MRHAATAPANDLPDPPDTDVTMPGMLKPSITRWRPGAYLRASWWMSSWLGLRALAQAGLVVALARTLGPTDYGAFVAVLAIASFFTPLAGMGVQAVVLREGSRHPGDLPRLLWSAKRVWRIGVPVFGTVACAIVLLTLRHHLGDSLGLRLAIVAMVFSEVASSSLTEIVTRRAQALRRTHAYGALQAGLVLSRVAALGLFLASRDRSLQLWLILYAASSAVYASVVARNVRRDAAGPLPGGGPAALARDGVPFAFAAFAWRLQIEFNKPVLAMLGFATVGILGVAQRVVDLAAIPLIAMQDALWPRVFSRASPPSMVLRIGLTIALLALVEGLLLYGLAPWLPRLFGSDFGAAAQVLRMLAWLPLLQLARGAGMIHLSATGHSSRLILVYALGAAFVVASTTWLVAHQGLQGAIVALYAGEVFTIALQWLVYRSPRNV